MGVYQDVIEAAHAYDVGIKRLRLAFVPKNGIAPIHYNLADGEWEEYQSRRKAVQHVLFDMVNKVVPKNEVLSWNVEEEKRIQKEQKAQKVQ